MITINAKLKILVLEEDINKDIIDTIISLNKYYVCGVNSEDIKIKDMFININKFDVLIIAKLEKIDISKAFNIIDLFLENGKEIICINQKQSNSNNTYLSNYLIFNGCLYI